MVKKVVFRRFNRSKSPINSVKHIAEVSTVLAATTNTVFLTVVDNVDTYTISDTNGVPTGATVNSFYLSAYFIAEGGEVANEVPLVDWYIIKDPGGTYGSTFDSSHLPTPGATGLHVNKRHIIHTEKGLAGGGDASTAGLPMIFKGVILIPKHMRRIAQNDKITIAARANFATKGCMQAIYKHYT